jgi:hypothetical protein
VKFFNINAIVKDSIIEGFGLLSNDNDDK